MTTTTYYQGAVSRAMRERECEMLFRILEFERFMNVDFLAYWEDGKNSLDEDILAKSERIKWAYAAFFIRAFVARKEWLDYLFTKYEYHDTAPEIPKVVALQEGTGTVVERAERKLEVMVDRWERQEEDEESLSRMTKQERRVRPTPKSVPCIGWKHWALEAVRCLVVQGKIQIADYYAKCEAINGYSEEENELTQQFVNHALLLNELDDVAVALARQLLKFERFCKRFGEQYVPTDDEVKVMNEYRSFRFLVKDEADRREREIEDGTEA